MRPRSTFLQASALAAGLFVAAPVFGGQAAKPAPALSAPEQRAAKALEADTIKTVTSALSAPEMEGRGTGTPGGERAAEYIADHFKKLGFEPGGDAGSFLQAVPFDASQVQTDTSLSVGATKLELAKDFVPAPPFLADRVDVSGNLVFVGYGVVNDGLGRDDLAGLDLKGKIAIVLSGRPQSVDEAAWRKASSRQSVMAELIAKGAGAVVFVGLDSAHMKFDQLADYLTRRGVRLAGDPKPPTNLPPVLLASPAGAEKLFAAAGSSYADAKTKAETGAVASRDLGASATLAIRVKRESVTAHNVVAVLRGSDPTLKAQAVLFTAHYDAFGRGLDGRIYPGAADNALGVGEIVAVAEAFAKSKTKPRRSLVFLAVCGEEFGLLGAQYWAAHPTWPLDAVVADINYDGIGTETYGPVGQVVGFGAEYSTLGDTLDAVASTTGLTVIADPMPEEQAFYRSDHFALVQKGIPALMLLGGPAGDTATWIKRASTWLETDYHQSTDVVRPDWNWDGARTIAEVGLVVGLRVADGDTAPEWRATSPFKRPPVSGS